MKEEWYVVPARRAMRAEDQPRSSDSDEQEIEAALLVLTPRSERRERKEGQ